MKYLATNDEVYIQARSLSRLSAKVEKYLKKLAHKRLKESFEITDWELYFEDEVIEVFNFKNQVTITKLGEQNISIVGTYRHYDEISNWAVKEKFKVYKEM